MCVSPARGDPAQWKPGELVNKIGRSKVYKSAKVNALDFGDAALPILIYEMSLVKLHRFRFCQGFKMRVEQ